MSTQLEAERSHVLIELISELGGLAHQDMDTAELDTIVDNMLSNGVPTTLSPDLQRWIHTHRVQPGLNITQILGAHVNKASSIIPECFGRFYDANAVECKACLDRTACKMKSSSRKADEPIGLVSMVYPVGKNVSVHVISTVLQGKNGQIAKTLSHGGRVILEVVADKLKVLAVTNPNESGQALTETDTMAKTTATKGKPAAAPIEEEEVDLNLAGIGDDDAEEVEADAEEVEEAVAQPAAKTKPAAAPAAKPEKVAKPKPVLNKLQQDFQTALDGKTGEEKQKYSAAVAAKLKIVIESKNDARIDHMARVMAIKKHLGCVKVK